MITACAIRTARFLAVFVSCWLAGLPWVSAHPHVFIEGGVDFVVDDSRNLAALDVTWHYDPFETLYLLSSIGIVPAPDGTLSPEDTAKLIAHLGAWPDDFDGARISASTVCRWRSRARLRCRQNIGTAG